MNVQIGINNIDQADNRRQQRRGLQNRRQPQIWQQPLNKTNVYICCCYDCNCVIFCFIAKENNRANWALGIAVSMCVKTAQFSFCC
jgi:hypothetical protein